ncbi:MAG: beta-ketoacyl-[acyl-carrier-protein] synthase family protein [Planctomycetales bacterium]|nr:beta-ketoacyl-[acyl-carrier-protein] synthase family protein [Planctomycetales bacterium]
MSQRPAVWITGVGLTTSLGHRYDEFAENLLAGRSGIHRVERFNVDEHPSQIAGLAGDIHCPEGDDESQFASLLRLEQMAHWCGRTALRDAQLDTHGLRVGLILGMGAEWMQMWEPDRQRGGHRLRNAGLDDESVVTKAQRRLGLRGPTLTISAACASGNWALAEARRWLQLGWADVCLAGAIDNGVSPLSMAGFGNLRALSRKNDAPQAASRPFDKHRDGMVLGDGGALFILERETDARSRGVRGYAEVAGFAGTSDAHHLVIPCPEPAQGIAAMRQALHNANVGASEISYINAHATSTCVGDVGEARVLQAVLGNSVGDIPISSTKSMTGHLLSAAAAVEAAACLVALERQMLPPTINLYETDPDCAMLRHVPHHAVSHAVSVAVSNSFGFGGNNTSLVLRAVA